MNVQILEPTERRIPYANVDRLPWWPLVEADGLETKTLCTSESSVAALLRLRPGAAYVNDTHLDREHHLWVVAGTLMSGETVLTAGSYLHVPPGVAHSLEDGGEGSLVFSVQCAVPEYYAELA